MSNNYDVKKVGTTTIKGKQFKFYLPNEICLVRAKTILKKEPETIEWLDSLSADDILWDVGANVGMYTIYPALLNNTRVVSFEPGSSNYHVLNKNIQINNLVQLATAYCIGLGDRTGQLPLYLQSTDFGAAQNALERPQNDMGQEYVPDFIQGMISFSADYLIYELGFEIPTAIKIDVDGYEIPLLKGANKLFFEKKVKKISIELNTDFNDIEVFVRDFMSEHGLTFISARRGSIFGKNSPVKNFHFSRI